MGSCLTPVEVEAFLAGPLSPEEKARAEAHLAECDLCRQAVDEATSRFR